MGPNQTLEALLGKVQELMKMLRGHHPTDLFDDSGAPGKELDQVLLEIDLILSDHFWRAWSSDPVRRAWLESFAKVYQEYLQDLSASLMAVLCPRCQKGHPVLRRRKADGKFFFGCSDFPRCDFGISVEEAEELSEERRTREQKGKNEAAPG